MGNRGGDPRAKIAGTCGERTIPGLRGAVDLLLN